MKFLYFIYVMKFLRTRYKACTYNCLHFGKTFTDQSAQAHIKTHQGLEERALYKCEVCGKRKLVRSLSLDVPRH